jgi:hypothetical protein
MRRANSRVFLLPLRERTGLGFWGVGALVIGELRIGNREASRGRMVDAGGEFAAKAAGADVGGILVAHAMGDESVVGNGHKIFGKCAADTAKGERVLAERTYGLKTKVLQDNSIAHKGPISKDMHSQM